MSRADEPAFPITDDVVTVGMRCEAAQGMTVREYAAIQAMQGILSSVDHVEVAARASGKGNKAPVYPAVAAQAIRYADALLDRLEQTEDGNAQVD